MPYNHAARAEVYREMIEAVEATLDQQEKINILEDFILDERRALDGLPQSGLLRAAQQKKHWLANPPDLIQPMGLFNEQPNGNDLAGEFFGLNFNQQ